MVVCQVSASALLWKKDPNEIAYETSKRFLVKRFSPDPLPVWATLTAGGIGGLGYWLTCYPLDVVKSRVQLADAPPARGGWASGGYIARELSAVMREGGV